MRVFVIEVFVRTTTCLVLLSVSFGTTFAAESEKPFGIEKRIPWTTSRLRGSPEPPPPYSVEKVLKGITWKAPIYIAAEPGSDRLFVVEQGGEKDRPSKILRVTNAAAVDETQALLQMTNRLIYGLTFHPNYASNGFVFVFSNGPWGRDDRTNRVSRFTVSHDAPQSCDPVTERVIIEWRSAGHDGGDLVFGRDGMLYIGSGDGTSDSDRWVTGQDISNLLGTVLRINVDGAADEERYRIPPDNPFRALTNARPEIWAYGLRNPWRLTVDRKTGHIWVGNNGQDLWETAHLVRPAENYGWSVYEGSHPFYPNRQRGPTPIVKPTIEHHHSEFRSLTGGVVYYGEPLSKLNGIYVYGDYSTGKIWGARHDGERLVWHSELADTSLQIAAFAVDANGELLIADLSGGIYRLIRSPVQSSSADFPVRLSETGLFTSVPDHQVAPGIIPYAVNAPGWMDGATAERFIAMPGDSKIAYKSSRGWDFPDGAVLVQTLSVEVPRKTGRHRVETRILLRQQGEWAGYSYRWNSEQTDACLVPAKGAEFELAIRDARVAGGMRKQNWKTPSRADCMVCHSRAVNYVLGLTELQMNREHDYGPMRDNQLRTLEHAGFFAGDLSKLEKRKKLTDSFETRAELEGRVRSYLHVNCSVCHVEAGGGNARMELEFTTPRDKMNLVSARPQHDTFGIHDAMLVAPGDPEGSVLFRRLSRRGPGQMPPLGSTVVDHQAIQLFRDWISQMKPERAFVRDWRVEDLLPAFEDPKQSRSVLSGKAAFRDIGCIQCHRITGEGGSVGPDLTGVGGRLGTRELVESILLPSKVVAEPYVTSEIETTDGEVITGRMEEEDDATILIRASSAVSETTVVKKANVARRLVSKTSNMPEGIVNVLRKEEILDLIAYLLSNEVNAQAAAGK